jgi:hypothetical protein
MSWDLKIKVLLFGIVMMAVISVVTSNFGSLSNAKLPTTVLFYVALAAFGAYVLFLVLDR